MYIYELKKSDKPNKKYKITIYYNDHRSKIKTIYFGASGYEVDIRYFST